MSHPIHDYFVSVSDLTVEIPEEICCKNYRPQVPLADTATSTMSGKPL